MYKKIYLFIFPLLALVFFTSYGRDTYISGAKSPPPGGYSVSTNGTRCHLAQVTHKGEKNTRNAMRTKGRHDIPSINIGGFAWVPVSICFWPFAETYFLYVCPTLLYHTAIFSLRGPPVVC
jgi:hypothetical protein